MSPPSFMLMLVNRTDQYPGTPPPPPPELEEDLGAEPDGVTSCHTPPEMLSPLPWFWPGAVSPV
jgi:hypothetical protein